MFPISPIFNFFLESENLVVCGYYSLRKVRMNKLFTIILLWHLFWHTPIRVCLMWFYWLDCKKIAMKCYVNILPLLRGEIHIFSSFQNFSCCPVGSKERASLTACFKVTYIKFHSAVRLRTGILK